MTAKLARADGDRYMFHCPGCEGNHQFKVPPWTFDGNMELPTVGGSVLVQGQEPREYEDEHGEVIRFKGWPTCHSFISAGRIQFLGDSTHALAGQTVDLPDWTPGQW